ncbi:conserved Plasmodium protein, unknown function [Plasmodium ovale]|uniref:Uncharacterized protein n=1 Tax=Plasmodium ovale TaxID=36330 RepID=A0A1D3TIF7_PLAOA|nr:conserved Plasmodium protein, unknown function [Plasmodium ovale]
MTYRIKYYGHFSPEYNLHNRREEEKSYLEKEKLLYKIYNENISHLQFYNDILKKRIKRILDGVDSLLIIINNDERDVDMLTLGGGNTSRGGNISRSDNTSQGGNTLGILFYLINDLVFRRKRNYEHFVKFIHFEIKKNKMIDKLKNIIITEKNIVDVGNCFSCLLAEYDALNYDDDYASKDISPRLDISLNKKKKLTHYMDYAIPRMETNCMCKVHNAFLTHEDIDNFLKKRNTEKLKKDYTKEKNTHTWDPGEVKKVYLTDSSMTYILEELLESDRHKRGLGKVKRGHNRKGKLEHSGKYHDKHCSGYVLYTIFEFERHKVNKRRCSEGDVIKSSVVIIVIRNMKRGNSLQSNFLYQFYDFFFKLKKYTKWKQNLLLPFCSKIKSMIIKYLSIFSNMSYLSNLHKLNDTPRVVLTSHFALLFELNFIFILNNFSKYIDANKIIYAYLKYMNRHEYLLKPHRGIKYIKSNFHKMEESIYICRYFLNHYRESGMFDKECWQWSANLSKHLTNLQTSVIHAWEWNTWSNISNINNIQNILYDKKRWHFLNSVISASNASERKGFFSCNLDGKGNPFVFSKKNARRGTITEKDISKKKRIGKFRDAEEGTYLIKSKYGESYEGEPRQYYVHLCIEGKPYCDSKGSEENTHIYLKLKRESMYRKKIYEKYPDIFVMHRNCTNRVITQKEQNCFEHAKKKSSNATANYTFPPCDVGKTQNNTIEKKERKFCNIFSMCRDKNDWSKNMYGGNKVLKKCNVDLSLPKKENSRNDFANCPYNNDHFYFSKDVIKERERKKNILGSIDFKMEDVFNDTLIEWNVYDRCVVNQEKKEKKMFAPVCNPSMAYSDGISSSDEKGNVKSFLRNIKRNRDLLKNVSSSYVNIKKGKKRTDRKAESLFAQVESCLTGKVGAEHISSVEGTKRCKDIDIPREVDRNNVHKEIVQREEKRVQKKSKILSDNRREVPDEKKEAGTKDIPKNGKKKKSIDRKTKLLRQQSGTLRNRNAQKSEDCIGEPDKGRRKCPLIAIINSEEDKGFEGKGGSKAENNISLCENSKMILLKGEKSKSGKDESLEKRFSPNPYDKTKDDIYMVDNSLQNVNHMFNSLYSIRQGSKEGRPKQLRYSNHGSSSEEKSPKHRPANSGKGERRKTVHEEDTANVLINEDAGKGLHMRSKRNELEGPDRRHIFCNRRGNSAVFSEEEWWNSSVSSSDSLNSRCSGRDELISEEVHGKKKCAEGGKRLLCRRRVKRELHRSTHDCTFKSREPIIYNNDCLPTIRSSYENVVMTKMIGGDGTEMPKRKDSCAHSSNESVFSFSSKNKKRFRKNNNLYCSKIVNNEMSSSCKSVSTGGGTMSPEQSRKSAINKCQPSGEREKNRISKKLFRIREIKDISSLHLRPCNRDRCCEIKCSEDCAEEVDDNMILYHRNIDFLVRKHIALLRKRCKEDSDELRLLEKIKFAKGILNEYSKLLNTKWDSKKDIYSALNEIVTSRYNQECMEGKKSQRKIDKHMHNKQEIAKKGKNADSTSKGRELHRKRVYSSGERKTYGSMERNDDSERWLNDKDDREENGSRKSARNSEKKVSTYWDENCHHRSREVQTKREIDEGTLLKKLMKNGRDIKEFLENDADHTKSETGYTPEENEVHKILHSVSNEMEKCSYKHNTTNGSACTQSGRSNYRKSNILKGNKCYILNDKEKVNSFSLTGEEFQPWNGHSSEDSNTRRNNSTPSIDTYGKLTRTHEYAQECATVEETYPSAHVSSANFQKEPSLERKKGSLREENTYEIKKKNKGSSSALSIISTQGIVLASSYDGEEGDFSPCAGNKMGEYGNRSVVEKERNSGREHVDMLSTGDMGTCVKTNIKNKCTDISNDYVSAKVIKHREDSSRMIKREEEKERSIVTEEEKELVPIQRKKERLHTLFWKKKGTYKKEEETTMAINTSLQETREEEEKKKKMKIDKRGPRLITYLKQNDVAKELKELYGLSSSYLKGGNTKDEESVVEESREGNAENHDDSVKIRGGRVEDLFEGAPRVNRKKNCVQKVTRDQKKKEKKKLIARDDFAELNARKNAKKRSTCNDCNISSTEKKKGNNSNKFLNLSQHSKKKKNSPFIRGKRVYRVLPQFSDKPFNTINCSANNKKNSGANLHERYMHAHTPCDTTASNRKKRNCLNLNEKGKIEEKNNRGRYSILCNTRIKGNKKCMPFYVQHDHPTSFTQFDTSLHVSKNSFARSSTLLGGTAHVKVGNLYPFERSAPHFEGSAPHFEGSAPHFEGSAPHFEGSAPHFEGSEPHFEGGVSHFEGNVPHFEESVPNFLRTVNNNNRKVNRRVTPPEKNSGYASDNPIEASYFGRNTRENPNPCSYNIRIGRSPPSRFIYSEEETNADDFYDFFHDNHCKVDIPSLQKSREKKENSISGKLPIFRPSDRKKLNIISSEENTAKNNTCRVGQTIPILVQDRTKAEKNKRGKKKSEKKRKNKIKIREDNDTDTIICTNKRREKCSSERRRKKRYPTDSTTSSQNKMEGNAGKNKMLRKPTLDNPNDMHVNIKFLKKKKIKSKGDNNIQIRDALGENKHMHVPLGNSLKNYSKRVCSPLGDTHEEFFPRFNGSRRRSCREKSRRGKNNVCKIIHFTDKERKSNRNVLDALNGEKSVEKESNKMECGNQEVERICIKTTFNRDEQKIIPCISHDTNYYNFRRGWWNWGGEGSKLFSKIEKCKENIKKKYNQNRNKCKNKMFTNSTGKYFKKFLPNEYLYTPITNRSHFKSKNSLHIKSNPISDFHKLNLRPFTGFLQSYNKEKKKLSDVPRAIIKVSAVPYSPNGCSKPTLGGNGAVDREVYNTVGNTVDNTRTRGWNVGRVKIHIPHGESSHFNGSSESFAKISKKEEASATATDGNGKFGESRYNSKGTSHRWERRKTRGGLSSLSKKNIKNKNVRDELNIIKYNEKKGDIDNYVHGEASEEHAKWREMSRGEEAVYRRSSKRGRFPSTERRGNIYSGESEYSIYLSSSKSCSVASSSNKPPSTNSRSGYLKEYHPKNCRIVKRTEEPIKKVNLKIKSAGVNEQMESPYNISSKRVHEEGKREIYDDNSPYSICSLSSQNYSSKSYKRKYYVKDKSNNNFNDKKTFIQYRKDKNDYSMLGRLSCKSESVNSREDLHQYCSHKNIYTNSHEENYINEEHDLMENYSPTRCVYNINGDYHNYPDADFKLEEDDIYANCYENLGKLEKKECTKKYRHKKCNYKNVHHSSDYATTDCHLPLVGRHRRCPSMSDGHKRDADYLEREYDEYFYDRC